MSNYLRCSALSLADPAVQDWRESAGGQDALRVLDCAYAPLRLDAEGGWTGAPPPRMPSNCWQLWTPNKAPALTDVRAAYAIAPTNAADSVERLRALTPSWPLGAHGLALLQAWASPRA